MRIWEILIYSTGPKIIAKTKILTCERNQIKIIINLFIQQILIDSLLCAKYFTRNWRHKDKGLSLMPTGSGTLGQLQNFKYVATMETFIAWGCREFIKDFPEWLTARLRLTDQEHGTREERSWEKRKTNITLPPLFFYLLFQSKAVFKLIYLQPMAAVWCEKTLGRGEREREKRVERREERGERRVGREGGGEMHTHESLLRFDSSMQFGIVFLSGLGNYTLS